MIGPVFFKTERLLDPINTANNLKKINTMVYGLIRYSNVATMIIRMGSIVNAILIYNVAVGNPPIKRVNSLELPIPLISHPYANHLNNPINPYDQC